MKLRNQDRFSSPANVVYPMQLVQNKKRFKALKHRYFTHTERETGRDRETERGTEKKTEKKRERERERFLS